METTLTYILLALVAATLIVGLYLAAKIKTIHYLLQQPVVKKMSPQLRLKPVKLEETLDRNRQGGRGQGRDRGERSEGGRGEGRERNDEERGGRGRGRGRGGRDRDGQEGREPRGERSEGGRGEGRERNDEERGGRGRGRGRGDRDRNRDGRERGGDRPQRAPLESNNRDENRESAPAPQAPQAAAPAAAAREQAPLSPRRPLPTTENSESRDARTSAAQGSDNASSSDPFVGAGNDNDLQHGRRVQLKKKPRIELDEEDVKI